MDDAVLILNPSTHPVTLFPGAPAGVLLWEGRHTNGWRQEGQIQGNVTIPLELLWHLPCGKPLLQGYIAPSSPAQPCHLPSGR